MLIGKNITLMPYTNERCQEVYKSYVSDPLMTYDAYSYDEKRVDQFYAIKVQDPTRCFFAIVYKDITVGEIQLKYMNALEKYGTLSIVIANDEFKNKGFGTEAIQLILKYATENLQFKKVYADAVLRNSRSQHVLERIGFKFIREDQDLKYYEILLN